RRQEAGLRRETARRRPIRHLRPIEEEPAAIRRVRQAFGANPILHDLFRNAERLGNLDEIQIHGGKSFQLSPSLPLGRNWKQSPGEGAPSEQAWNVEIRNSGRKLNPVPPDFLSST